MIEKKIRFPLKSKAFWDLFNLIDFGTYFSKMNGFPGIN